jgi:hypothetical protein
MSKKGKKRFVYRARVPAPRACQVPVYRIDTSNEWCVHNALLHRGTQYCMVHVVLAGDNRRRSTQELLDLAAGRTWFEEEQLLFGLLLARLRSPSEDWTVQAFYDDLDRLLFQQESEE